MKLREHVSRTQRGVLGQSFVGGRRHHDASREGSQKCSFGTRAERVRSSLNTIAHDTRTPTDTSAGQPPRQSLQTRTSRSRRRASGHPGGSISASRSGANSGASRFRPSVTVPCAGRPCVLVFQQIGRSVMAIRRAHRQIETPKIPFGISRDGAGAVTTRGTPAQPQLQWYRWRLIMGAHFNLQHLGVLAAGLSVLRATLGQQRARAPPAPAALSGRAGHAHSTRVAGPAGAALPPPRRRCRSWRAARVFPQLLPQLLNTPPTSLSAAARAPPLCRASLGSSVPT